MVTTNNVLIIGPVFAPLAAAALCLLASGHQFDKLRRYLALAAMVIAWLCSLALLHDNVHDGIQVYRLGGWITPYGIVLAVDQLSAIFGVMGTTVVMMGILYAVTCHDHCIEYPAFMSLFLCMGAGLSGAFYTGDVFTLFVFVELMVISSVVMVAISDNYLGLEAAIKYLFISAMGTLFILLGIAALYTTFGTLTLADIALKLSSGERPLLAEAAAIMLMCAFLVKSAVFPFHFWQPDFHTTAPTPVHSVLSSVVVKIGVYGLIRMNTLLFIEEAQLVRELLLVLGLIGIFFGSLAAFRTYDAKRMLAYSTFGQIGFILVAIGWGSPLALVGAIVYAVNHALIKSALLMLTGVVASRLKSHSAALRDLGGAGSGLRLTSGLYLLGGLALAGVPPLNGFISKLAVIRGGVDAESWLVVGLVVGAGILTLLYMLKTWQLIFQQPPTHELHLAPQGADPLYAPLLLILLCVGLGLYAQPLVQVASDAVTQIGDSQIYIRAVMGG